MKSYIEQLEELELSISDYWVLLRAYANSLPDAELLDLYIQRFSKNAVIHSLLKMRDIKALATIQHKIIQRELKTLNKNRLSDKRVVPGDRALRGELRVRYEFASKNDKRKILEMFLTSYKAERMFAYSQLYKNWDEYFKQIIINVYNRYHDGECLKVFIRHFPKSFLNSIFGDIEDFYNYSYACYCVGSEYVQIIDKQKLKPYNYLRLMAYFKRNVPKIEAEKILYETFAEELRRLLQIFVNSGDYFDKKEFRSNFRLLKYFPNSKNIIGSFGIMGYTDNFLNFAKICLRTNEIIIKSLEDNFGSDVSKVYDKIIALLPEPQRYGKFEIKKITGDSECERDCECYIFNVNEHSEFEDERFKEFRDYEYFSLNGEEPSY